MQFTSSPVYYLVDFCLQASHVLAALQAGSRGTQACINAASTVSGIIGDLDTTIMFATAGTLNSEKEGENFSDHREYILKTAKVIIYCIPMIQFIFIYFM